MGSDKDLVILKEISQFIRQRLVTDMWPVYNVCIDVENNLETNLPSILKSNSLIKSDGFLIDTK